MTTVTWKRKRIELEDETLTDRQVAILLRLQPGQRLVVPHECRPGNGVCAMRTMWHRSGKLAKVKVRTAHDDVGRLLVWIDSPATAYGHVKPYAGA